MPSNYLILCPPLLLLPSIFPNIRVFSNELVGRLVGFLELQRQCGVSHEVLRGAQGASHVALGKSGLHAHCEGERVIALESWKVYRASRTVKEGLSRCFLGHGSKPWVPSTSAGGLRELLSVPLRSQGYPGVSCLFKVVHMHYPLH